MMKQFEHPAKVPTNGINNKPVEKAERNTVQAKTTGPGPRTWTKANPQKAITHKA